MSRPKFHLESLETRSVLTNDLAAVMATAVTDSSVDLSADQMAVAAEVDTAADMNVDRTTAVVIDANANIRPSVDFSIWQYKIAADANADVDANVDADLS